MTTIKCSGCGYEYDIEGEKAQETYIQCVNCGRIAVNPLKSKFESEEK